MSGGEAHTTNNRMELKAAIEGLRALKQRCEVVVTTDSEYLKNGITKWIQGWKSRDWVTKEKKPVLNRDLWEELDQLSTFHNTSWEWTRGHDTHHDNNRCDELAQAAARKQGSR
jgi:ribonuclease HI